MNTQVRTLALGPTLRASLPKPRKTAVHGLQHNKDSINRTSTRRDFVTHSVLICPCGCLARRTGWYDEYFAWNMAHGMTGYEAEITPTKQCLFQHITRQTERLGRPVDMIDVGIGTGPNLPYYAANARTIVGLDPNSYMAGYAVQACQAADCDPTKLSFVEGFAESMPFPEASFDTVVCTLTLCSVLDPPAALSEMRRVLRPGGALLFIEHVKAFDSGVLRLQQAVLDPLQRALADGCHLTRDTAALLEMQEWQSLQLDRFSVSGASLISPHIAGVAVI
eukprot:jgi/Ulvmu1/5046/UM021_0063.1